YAYKADDETCKYKPEMKAASIKSFKGVKKGDEQQLKTAVEAIGPISVAIDASSM
ncbi:Cathepsin L1, partial [Caligus rogercresseyi]